jgi:hypothetical protein
MTFRDPAYLGNERAERRPTRYSPEWLEKLADNVTIEGAALRGLVEGVENVKTIVAGFGELQEFQEVNYAGPCAHNCNLEDYVTEIQGQPTGVVTMTYHDDTGTVEHVIVNHRPRSAVTLVSDLLRQEFAGSPLAAHFGTAS